MFAANYAGSGLAGDANQYLTLTGNSISTDSGGVTLGNLAEADDTYYVASTAVAYQSASLTNNTIVSTGFGVGYEHSPGAPAPTRRWRYPAARITVGDADWIGIDDGEVAGRWPRSTSTTASSIPARRSRTSPSAV